MNRRDFLLASAGLATLPLLPSNARARAPLNRRPIPRSGEMLPIIGMGTSRTFDTSASEDNLMRLTEVMRVFLEGGGRLLDSSPMYGEAESRVGDVLSRLQGAAMPFAATKVWTEGEQAGIAQMDVSVRHMGVERFDLMQIHNLVDWRTHLATLQRWRDEGRIRYLGITTSHRRNHEEFERIMQTQQLDFVQFSYNIDNRQAEERLLPLAADRGIATLINRPYQRGALFSKVRNRELPEVAHDLKCTSWGQFFLKFIAGHPAVTCVIPASSKPGHMLDNIKANTGPLPDADQRIEMLEVFRAL